MDSGPAKNYKKRYCGDKDLLACDLTVKKSVVDAFTVLLSPGKAEVLGHGAVSSLDRL